MQKLPIFASALLALATLAPAQSPLTTTLAGGNGLGTNAGVFFNLTVNPGGVTLTGFDVHVAGTTVGSLDLFLIPGGTHVGNEGIAAPWILVGNAPLTGLGANQWTNAVLGSPVPLSAGNYAVGLRYNNCSPNYTNGNGTNQTYSTAEMTLNAGSALGTPFNGGTAITPRVWNGRIYYTNGGSSQFASASSIGTGCVAGASSFYEEFAVGTADLTGRSILMTVAGGGYAVTAGSTSFFTHTVPGLGLGDDTVSAAQTLPFTMLYPGGTTNSLRIDSNGSIYLSASGASDFSPTVAELLSVGPRIAPFWLDLVCDGATNTANVYFEVDTASNTAYVTWLAVPQYQQPANLVTVQVAITAATVEIRYQTVGNPTTTAITGFSPGGGARNPGNRDITATLPFVTQAEQAPLALAASARPLIGTTINLNTTSVPAGALSGVNLLGVALLPTPIDLGAIGMGGCTLYTNPIVNLPMTLTPPTGTLPLALPNNSFLLGLQLYLQSAVVSPGSTSLGIIISNGLELKLGNA